MSVNISISYILYNKDIIVNLHKLHFPSSPFSLQPNKKVFHSPTFPPLQPSTHKENQIFSILPLFHPPTNFPPSHFSTPPTKRTLNPMPPSPLAFFNSSHLNQWIFLHVIWWRVGLHKIQFFKIQIPPILDLEELN